MQRIIQKIMPESTADYSKREITVEAVIRGNIYSGKDIDFSSRDGKVVFTGPDPKKLISDLVLGDTSSLATDFEDVTVGEIIDFLAETGEAFDFDRNTLMQDACELSKMFNGLTAPIIESAYRQVPLFFNKNILEVMVENEIGSSYLDGWVETPVHVGRALVRAYGAKALHISDVPMLL